MLATAYEKMDGNYGRWAVLREIDSEALLRARNIFETYRERGIIMNGSFDDPSWTLSNQTITVGLTLIAFEGSFHKSAASWIGCSYRQYQDCVKAYIAFHLGEISLYTLQELSKTIISLSGKTSEEAIAYDEYIHYIIEFLQMLPGCCSERDCVIETLEERNEKRLNVRKGKQRRLSNFSAYLKFNEILSDFWKEADYRQKLFYFPLYFWWNLTSILPLRPTELLLTPRDCLKDGNTLTIRRTKLKGGLEKVAYRIENDYERKQYVIPGYLADEVRAYLCNTEKMPRTEIDTLFLQKPHFNYIGRNGYIKNWYYTYVNLHTCLRYFYHEIVPQRSAGLNMICFGDTRHIAMVGLILSGGSPVICMELAGHSDIDISSHYYSNISNMVGCITLEQYRKLKNGGAVMSGVSKYPLSTPKIKSRVSGGWCGSPEMASGGVGDCLKVGGSQEHIGDCRYCGHYYPDNPGVRTEFLNEAKGKQRVDNDCQYLMRMIELARKGLGHQEDIGVALLRLQRSNNHYGRCLWEKYAKGEMG